MKKALRKIFFVGLHGIGFILLYLVVRNLQWQQISSLFALLPAWKFIAGLLLLFIVYILKTLRWFIINRSFGIQISYGETLTYYLVSGFLGAVTPGRLGEFAKVYFLKKNHNTTFTRGTTSVFLDRIWDVLVLSFMAVFSVILLFNQFHIEMKAIIVIASLFLLSLTIIIFPTVFFSPAIALSSRWPRFQKELIKISGYWTKERSSIFIPAFFLSLVSFLILAFVPLMFSLSLNAPVPFYSSISAVSISNILSFIPITIAGFGTREVVFTGIWQMLEYSAETGITVSTAFFLSTYIGSVILGGSVYLFRFRKHFKWKELRNPNAQKG